MTWESLRFLPHLKSIEFSANEYYLSLESSSLLIDAFSLKYLWFTRAQTNFARACALVGLVLQAIVLLQEKLSIDQT